MTLEQFDELRVGYEVEWCGGLWTVEEINRDRGLITVRKHETITASESTYRGKGRFQCLMEDGYVEKHQHAGEKAVEFSSELKRGHLRQLAFVGLVVSIAVVVWVVLR